MGTKLFGLILIAIGILLFRTGLGYKDSGHGARLTNVNLLGSALLLSIGGIALLLTSKSICEIFGLFC